MHRIEHTLIWEHIYLHSDLSKKEWNSVIPFCLIKTKQKHEETIFRLDWDVHMDRRRLSHTQ